MRLGSTRSKVDASAADRVRHGAPVAWSHVVPRQDGEERQIVGEVVRIHDGSGRLLAVGRPSGSHITIEKVFVNGVV